MNYYELLKVSEDADIEEIKKSYKKLVKEFHPDIYKGDKNFAENKIKKLNEAYEILSDKASRAEYDRVLKEMREQTSKIFENNSNTSTSSSSFYQAEDLEKRYNEMYTYDYYKRYTTNYYGVDKSKEKNQAQEAPKTFVDFILDKSKSFIDNSLQNSPTRFLVISMSILAILGLITVIVLLGKVSDLLSSANSTTSESLSNLTETMDNQNVYWGENYNSTVEENESGTPTIDENYLNNFLESHQFNGVIKIGSNAFEITAFYGQPDSYTEKDGKIYAYYKDSYVVYDQTGFVVDFQNNGFFLTEEVLEGEYDKY